MRFRDVGGRRRGVVHRPVRSRAQRCCLLSPRGGCPLKSPRREVPTAFDDLEMKPSPNVERRRWRGSGSGEPCVSIDRDRRDLPPWEIEADQTPRGRGSASEEEKILESFRSGHLAGELIEASDWVGNLAGEPSPPLARIPNQIPNPQLQIPNPQYSLSSTTVPSSTPTVSRGEGRRWPEWWEKLVGVVVWMRDVFCREREEEEEGNG